MKRNRWSWLLLVAIGLLAPAGLGAAEAVKEKAKKKGPPPSTTAPAPRTGSWMQRHEKMNARVAQGNVDLIFIGDSITQGWEGAGKEVWEKTYKRRNAVNLGIGGDRTQHVLWRLENGNIEGISPKLAVVMIGTNNSGRNPPEEIVAGIKAIVETLRKKTPDTKVLLLGVFPRGEDDSNPNRQANMKVNEQIAKFADDKAVFYLDIGDKFLDENRKLSREIMPDLLHLTPKGYQIWADAIETSVKKLMGENEEK